MKTKVILMIIFLGIIGAIPWYIYFMSHQNNQNELDSCNSLCEKIKVWSDTCKQPMLGGSLWNCRNNFTKVREDQCWHSLLRIPEKVDCNNIPAIPYPDCVIDTRKKLKKQFFLPEYEN